jgi:hypothetical protein
MTDKGSDPNSLNHIEETRKRNEKMFVKFVM